MYMYMHCMYMYGTWYMYIHVLAIGPFHATLFELFTRIFARWRAEALLALTTMAACSQRVELRAA